MKVKTFRIHFRISPSSDLRDGFSGRNLPMPGRGGLRSPESRRHRNVNPVTATTLFVMYKKLALVLTLVFALLFISACSSTEPLRDRVVDHEYQNTTFKPEKVEKEVAPGLVVTIEPVDAGYLNEITHRAAFRDGGYESEYVSVLRTRRTELDDLSRSERRRVENMIEVTEKLQEHLSIGTFRDEDLIQLLLYRLWHGSEVGNDGSEVERLTDNPFLPIHNPYHQDGRYLSAFKVELKNVGNGIATLKRSNLQIMSGSELVSPLSMEHFEEVLERSSTKLDNALRMNLPEELNIIPGTNIAKYIAIPAFDVAVDELSIHYLEENSFERFTFGVDSGYENRRYSLDGFRVVPKISRSNRPGDDSNIVFAMRHVDGTAIALKDDIFFVDENLSSKRVDVCALAVHSRRQPKIGCEMQVRLSDLQTDEVEVDMAPF